MTSTDTEIEFEVDFAEAALDGRLSVLHGKDFPAVGTVVRLIDADGNRCPGTVVEVGKNVLWIEPALDRVSLAPVAATDALKAMLRTPPATD